MTTKIRAAGMAVAVALSLGTFAAPAVGATGQHWYDAGPVRPLNDSSRCSLPGGGTAYFAAYVNGGGVLTDVTLNSTVELSAGGSVFKAYDDASNLRKSGTFKAAPIDGDGYWNYVWSYHPNTLGGIERVAVTPRKESNNGTCGASLYP